MRACIQTPLFPKVFTTRKRFKNQILLGIGGNVGDCLKRFKHFILYLQNNPLVQVLSTSIIYKNPPFGYAHQADFYNFTLQISTNQSLIDCFQMIFYWERRFGRARKRVFPNAPRTLDIDLLYFNQVKLHRPYLQIPHKEWQNRESVLIPLSFHTLV
ncbi:2-amino-4-hydroxy-6-hydroxymethyldihydropteridine diphosphokinase [Helicobacter enhydrae]|uniref:2-amino-4-hydroxy-6-hydroxymethyldihydropteridine pyrophosphokinase n=1 Tax=Helicobacter enhydrae TaxID=222136 RepID=A0A1B1U4C3_9HELI|nr:2-amino-4-hydroxy-6-hydroxymethyldihydropteridine diphosphokinase [Helicobacter enhydrae]ANV97610.1 2-amino-4-hydroxy-6-hydroxymethyldihydropteridine diphosphokinase [Helicobacter enhydrae]